MSGGDRRETGSWFEKHVLDMLEALDSKVCSVETGMKELGDAIGGKDGIRERMARIEERTALKASFIGLLAGAIPVIIAWALGALR